VIEFLQQHPASSFWIQGIVAVFALWKTVHFVIGYIEEHVLLDPHREALQNRFKVWSQSVEVMKSKAFTAVFARAVSQLLAGFFGKRLFSARALWRSALLATGFLIASIFIASALGVDVSPKKEFQETVSVIGKLSEHRALTDGKSGIETEYRQTLKNLAERCGTPRWANIYAITFYVLLTTLNVAAFFFGVAFSRRVLQEIIGAGGAFSIYCLLLLNLVLVLLVASVFLLLTTVLAFPASWFGIALAYQLSKLSLFWIPALSLGGVMLFWIFGNPWLQSLAVIAVLPFFGNVAVCILSLVARRKEFQWLCTQVLLRGSGKKPLSFVTGLLAGFGFFLVSLLAIWRGMFL
jgi:hypothetical protein